MREQAGNARARLVPRSVVVAGLSGLRRGRGGTAEHAPMEVEVTGEPLLARARAILARWAWLLPGLACLALAYLVVWRRGLYLDDYANRAYAIHVLKARWWPVGLLPSYARALSALASPRFVLLVSTHELLARALGAFAVGANALLLGWLIYRVLGSRLAAVAGGWLFLVPIYAHEAALWGTAISYVLAGLFSLLFLHAAWSALVRPRRAGVWAVPAGAAFVASLLCVESNLAAAGLLVPLGLVAALRQPSVGSWPLRRAATLLAGLSAVAGACYLLLYRGTAALVLRGGLDLSPGALLARSRFFLASYGQTVASGRLLGQALTLGAATVRASPWAKALLAGAAAALTLAALAWPDRGRDEAVQRRAAVVAVAGSLAVLPAVLLFPGILVAGQWPAPRLLYFPGALASLTVGALLALAAGAVRLQWERALVAVAGLVLLVGSVAMLGLARTYSERSQLDRQQIASVVEALPAQHLPEGTTLLFLDRGETPLPRYDALNALLVGALERPWSAMAARRPAYGRADLQVCTYKRWATVRFRYIQDAGGAGGRLQVLSADSPDSVDALPVERTVPVTLQAGQAVAVESLAIQNADGSQQVVVFPLAQGLRQHGARTLENALVSGP